MSTFLRDRRVHLLARGSVMIHVEDPLVTSPRLEPLPAESSYYPSTARSHPRVPRRSPSSPLGVLSPPGSSELELCMTSCSTLLLVLRACSCRPRPSLPRPPDPTSTPGTGYSSLHATPVAQHPYLYSTDNPAVLRSH